MLDDDMGYDLEEVMCEGSDEEYDCMEDLDDIGDREDSMNGDSHDNCFGD